MCWFFKRKEISLEPDIELARKIYELRKRIDTLRKQIEDGDYVREAAQKNINSMGSREEEKGTEIRVENASQDVEKEKRKKELDDIKAKLLGRK